MFGAFISWDKCPCAAGAGQSHDVNVLRGDPVSPGIL